jgi:hypothetical protein
LAVYHYPCVAQGKTYDACLRDWRQVAIERYVAAHRMHVELPTPAEQPTTEQTLSLEPSAKGKTSGKQAKKAGGKASKGSSRAAAAAEAARAAAEAAAAEAHAKCVANARAAGSRCLKLMVLHVHRHNVTALQALQLMQLVPDVRDRLAFLAAVLPALHDKQRLLDIVLALNAPTPLAVPVPEVSSHITNSEHPNKGDTDSTATKESGAQEELPSQHQAIKAQQHKAWIHLTAEDIQQQMKLGTPSGDGSGTLPVPPTCAPAAAQSVEAAKPGKGKKPASAAAAAAAAAEVALPATPGAAQQPATLPPPPLLSQVLQLVLQRFGWGAMRLYWADPEAVAALVELGFDTNTLGVDTAPAQGQDLPPSCAEGEVADGSQRHLKTRSRTGIRLDLNCADQLQFAIQLFRWCEMARCWLDVPASEHAPVLEHVHTDAGALDLDHDSGWSYWDQVSKHTHAHAA